MSDNVLKAPLMRRGSWVTDGSIRARWTGQVSYDADGTSWLLCQDIDDYLVQIEVNEEDPPKVLRDDELDDDESDWIEKFTQNGRG